MQETFNAELAILAFFNTFVLIFPVLIFSIVIYLSPFVFDIKIKRIVKLTSLAFLAFGFIGVSAGFVTGYSRSPAASALIPAALTFIGGVAIISNQKGRVSRIIAIVSAISFSFNLMYGSLLGAQSRTIAEQNLKSFEYQKKEIETKFRLENYKKGLGID